MLNSIKERIFSKNILWVIVLAAFLNSVLSSLLSNYNYDLFSTHNKVLNLYINTGLFFIVSYSVILLVYRIFINEPVQYSVAIVGYPHSGKTTYIIRTLEEITKNQFLGGRIRVSGSSTIERYNIYSAQLKRGIPLEATKEKDIFPYRLLYTKGDLFKKNYKIEYGDFPGEDSKKYYEQYGIWFHTTEYFRWMSQADAFIFIVDLLEYSSDKVTYCANFIAATKAAWQNLIDNDIRYAKTIKISPTILIFNKIDILLNIYNEELNISSILYKAKYSKKIPNINEANPVQIMKLTNQIENDFSEIIDFFKLNSKNFHYGCGSSFSTVNRRFVGIEETLKFILP